MPKKKAPSKPQIIIRDRDGDQMEYNGHSQWDSVYAMVEDMKEYFAENSDTLYFNYCPYTVYSQSGESERPLYEVTSDDFAKLFNKLL